MNKNLLIILGIVLLVVILGLGLYAYNLKDMDIASPPVNKQPVMTTLETPTNDANQINEAFSNDQTMNLPQDGQLNEEQQEELSANPITSAKGVIKAKGTTSITVTFDYQGTTWDSEVSANQNTTVFLPSSNPKEMGELVGIGDLNVGDKVIVSSNSGILNQTSFTALSINKVK